MGKHEAWAEHQSMSDTLEQNARLKEMHGMTGLMDSGDQLILTFQTSTGDERTLDFRRQPLGIKFDREPMGGGLAARISGFDPGSDAKEFGAETGWLVLAVNGVDVRD